MTRYRYIKSTHSLQELPSMPEPVRPDGGYWSTAASVKYHCEDLPAYNAHVSSLRTIPVAPGSVKWEDGQEVEEGKDFEIVFEEVEIIAKPGTKVRVLFKDGKPVNGLDIHKEKVMLYLNSDTVYELAGTDIGGWHTDFYLKEFPSIAFNSVHFVHAEPVAVPLEPQEGDPYPELLSKIATAFIEGKDNHEIIEGLRKEFLISKK